MQIRNGSSAYVVMDEKPLFKMDGRYELYRATQPDQAEEGDREGKG